MSNLFPNVMKRVIPVYGQQIRYLPRWSHRRPVRVIPPEEYDSVNDTYITRKKYENPEPKSQIKPAQETLSTGLKINWNRSRQSTSQIGYQNKTEKSQTTFKVPKTVKPLTISKTTTSSKKTVDMLETTIDADGNFIYTKMKDNDPRIGNIFVEVKSKKEKDKKDLILLEGKRLIKDALDAGCQLEYIIFSRLQDVAYLKPSLPKLGPKLYKMPYREMQMWSDLTTTPGIMGIFKVPDTESFKPANDCIPLTVICDNIREPSNLGAILRTCSGVGCENVILTKGCVNVWDTKVLRSASGAHFKLHIKKKPTWDEVIDQLPPEASIYIADNKKIFNENSSVENVAELVQSVPVLPYYGVDFDTAQYIVLIVGGETEGISAQSYELASKLKGVRLNIPLSNDVDSLNTGTALGIIAFEVKRQLSRGRQVTHDSLSANAIT